MDTLGKILNFKVYERHIIVLVTGTIKWVDRLKFRGSEKWTCSKEHAFKVDGVYEGFKKSVGNLAFYSVLRAGHMVSGFAPFK